MPWPAENQCAGADSYSALLAVEAVQGASSDKLLAQLEVVSPRAVLVGLNPLNIRVFTATLEKGSCVLEETLFFDFPIPAQNLLEYVELICMPIEVLQSGINQNMEVREAAAGPNRMRWVLRGAQEAVRIEYNGDKGGWNEATLDDSEAGIRLRIVRLL